MPCLLDAPVLKVDAEAIHRLDTRDAKNLFSVWTVFARCADSVSQGRRLENLSWRLWTRETFCVAPGNNLKPSISTGSLPREIERSIHPSSDDMPMLSGSVDSIADDEFADFSSDSSPLNIDRPRIRRQDSCASSRSRGKERHITSDDFEKMVVSIVQSKEPLAAPLPLVAMPVMLPSRPRTEEQKAAPAPTLERSGSTSESDAAKGSSTDSCNSSEHSSSSPPPQRSAPSHPVVRGFSTSHIPMFQTVTSHPRPPTMEPIPEPTSSPAPKPIQHKKQQAKFALGGSSSCGESVSDRGHSPAVSRQQLPQIKRKMFQVGGSSEEENSLRSAMHSSRQGLLSPNKKQLSFSKQLVTRTIPAPAVDNEESEVDESAIEDYDDDDDWEDSIEESGKSSIDEKTFFQRVDSTVNLTSRRSLITLMIEGNGRQSRLGNGASQSTSAIHQGRLSRQGPSVGPSAIASPNDSDESHLMMRTTRNAHLRPINEIPRSNAQPINTAANMNHQRAALSPRTTRRNMLCTELTESLRRDLLWERSQKTQTANAVLKRRHTSTNVANLRQYPEKPVMKDNDVNASSWDQDFTREAFGGYHSKGW